jgi:hypothetical protein
MAGSSFQAINTDSDSIADSFSFNMAERFCSFSKADAGNHNFLSEQHITLANEPIFQQQS